MERWGWRLVGCGKCRCTSLSLNNDQLSPRVETNDAWIRQPYRHRRPAGRWARGRTLTSPGPTERAAALAMRAGSLRISI